MQITRQLKHKAILHSEQNDNNNKRENVGEFSVNTHNEMQTTAHAAVNLFPSVCYNRGQRGGRAVGFYLLPIIEIKVSGE